MKNKIMAALIIFICFFFGNWCSCKYQITKEDNLWQKDIENYLRTANIVSVAIDPKGGRTEPWRVNLDDGKIARQAIFKHLNRPRPTLLADSYKYEIAAYELDKLLDLNMVPPVVEREIKDIKGSLQLYLEDCITESYRKRKNIEPPDPEAFEKALEVVNIFENITYNPRDTRDILINKDDWKVCRVDFSQAFSPISELFPGCKINYCSEKLYQNLLELESNVVKIKLKPYLNDEEIRALLERKDIIIKKVKQLISAEEE